jgi:cobaltochelatase CobS
MSTADAEKELGPRGTLRFGSENRANLRKWLTAQNFPSLFVIGLSIKEMTLAYNDTSGKELSNIRRKLESGAALREEEEQAATQAATETVLDETGSTHTVTVDQPKTKGHALVKALEDLIEGTATRNYEIDEEMETKLRKIAQEEAEKVNKSGLSITRIEVKHRQGQITTTEGHFHPMFPVLCKMAISFGHDGYVPGIFLSGEASSGKTYSCKMLAKALGLDWHFNGAISMPHEMLGFIDAAGHYHRTPFREAYEHGGVYTFDEVDRSDPVALLAVNPHLANGTATFPDKQISRHPNCVIVCTANTWGTGADAKYAGATKLDAAFLSRFPMRLSWNIDLDLERKISGNEDWCNRVQAARKRAQEHGLQVMIDVRMTLAGAAMIAAGMSADMAAKHTYLANLNDAQRKQVES